MCTWLKLVIVAAGITAIYAVSLVPAYQAATAMKTAREAEIARINAITDQRPTAKSPEKGTENGF